MFFILSWFIVSLQCVLEEDVQHERDEIEDETRLDKNEEEAKGVVSGPSEKRREIVEKEMRGCSLERTLSVRAGRKEKCTQSC